ncbi:MAG: PrgI family protein [Candidatus Altiarchaeota archaeon]|nr:PrgI family protein [Candidatus Altiarchaeota archaeon]
MPYAIPANIRYEEKLLGPLTIKQSIYLGGFLMAAGMVYFNKTLNPTIKLPVAVLLAGIGAAFAFLNLEEILKNYIGFMQSTRQSSWISPAARQLMNIRSIRAESVFLNDYRVLGVIRITPINFGVLSEQDKDTVIYGFLEFLNALNFPIQIVMRSVNLDLEDYLNQLKRRIKQRDDKLALAYYEHFSEYMRSYIKVNKINDRHFYIVVSAKKKLTEKETIDNLEIQCNELTSRLSLSGIVATRMNDHQLINFYKSYFTDSFELYDSMISPITMYRKMWKDAPHPVAQSREDGAEKKEEEVKQ